MKSTWLRITRLLLPLAGTTLCGLASAQTHTTETSDFTMRFGASIEKTFARDFALTWSEEVRTRNASSDLDRIYSALGLSYQPAPWVKVAATYTFMALRTAGDSGTGWDLRNRLETDLTLQHRIGEHWKVSLRERIRTIWRTEAVDPLEKADPECLLRSRLMAEYTPPQSVLSPFAYVELSNTLNAPALAGNYVNKVRTSIGVTIELTPRSAIECYYRFDYNLENQVDAYPDGTLRQLTRKKQFNHIIGIFYGLSF